MPKQRSSQANTEPTSHVSGPSTVAQATGDLVDKLGFHGLGVARRGANVSLSRSTAANRARADLANKLRTAGKLGANEALPAGISIKFEATKQQIRAIARLPKVSD